MSDNNGVKFDVHNLQFPADRGKSLQGFLQFIRNESAVRTFGRGVTPLLDKRRSIADECGFPEPSELTPKYYQTLYDRNPVAARVVEVLPKETWQVTPDIFESEKGKVVTAFEQAWDKVGDGLSGERSHYRGEKNNPVWETLKVADELSGIGSYGVILFGFSDVRRGGKTLRDPCEPVLASYKSFYGEQVSDATKGVSMPEDDLDPNTVREQANSPHGIPSATIGKTSTVPDPNTTTDEDDTQDDGEGVDASTFSQEGATGLRLLFLRAFPESLAPVSQWETDMTSPRHNQPTMYMITLNDPTIQHGGTGLAAGTYQVHWTRVLHIADNTSTSPIYGVPRLRPVVNNVLSCDKILGADAEAYYRNVFMGLSFETHPQLGGDVKLEGDVAGLKDMYEQYINSADRAIVTRGMTVKPIAPHVVDPEKHWIAQIEAICIKIPIPKRIFMGSERGELASGQDDDAWNDTTKGRQTGYATSKIVVPFVNRLINATVLPVPAEGFYCEWPDITSMSGDQKASVALKKVQVITAWASGKLEEEGITLMDLLTKFLDFTEEQATAMMEAGQRQIEGGDEGLDDTDTLPGEEIEETEDGDFQRLGSEGNVPQG